MASGRSGCGHCACGEYIYRWARSLNGALNDNYDEYIAVA